MVDWIFASVGQMAEAVRTKKLSSQDLIELHIKRIKEVNPLLNAVVQLTEEDARRAAKEADEKVIQGAAIGPLHGVPMTLKDSIDTAGVITTGGVTGRMRHTPKQDATVAKRLKEAGAILLGKTNTPPLTLAFETTNRVYGQTNNPYDPTRTPGGSSGGAAAIIAAGGAPFDIGSDTGGSIRQPAHNCGITGLKPTSGRIPRTGHIISFVGHIHELTQLGPMARYVDDLIFLAPLLLGEDWIDPGIIPMPWLDPKQVDLSTLRAAYYTDNGLVSPRDDVGSCIESAAQALADEVSSLACARPQGVELADDMFRMLFDTDEHAWIRRLLQQANTMPTASVQVGDDDAPLYNAAMMTAVLEEWQRFRSRMAGFWVEHDVLICPVFTHPALPHEAVHSRELGQGYGLVNAFNLAGWPAVVVRGGSSTEGLPVGVQVVAPPWREDVALAVARFIESKTGGWQAPATW